MSFFSPRNRAEASDRLAGMTGYAAAFAALIYALNVGQALTVPPVSTYLDDAGLIGGLLIVIVFLPSFFIIKRRFGGPAVNPWKSDGFMSAALQRAGLTAFAGTFLSLILLTLLDRLILERVSAAVLLDLILAISLACFAMSFFLFSRDEGEGEDSV
ncbi:hypothetical protein [Maricaulis sp.]|uniref:hypothetical protein n=1 Tax=Maricaulis sp. TaxID=1486257 RepID=UPI002B2658E5|nr:hypothetical protein [Maricaulis sp.]